MTERALDIYQDWLDATSDAILRGDMETLGRFIALPYVHSSPDSRQIIETRSDMEAGHTAYGNTLRSLGVNHFIRLAAQAEFLSANYVEGHHVIHALRNATPVIPSFSSRMVLRNMGEVWKLTESHTSMRHGAWPSWIARMSPEPVEALWAEDDARRDAVEPLALYQSFLNRLTQANVSGDFTAFCRLCEFPLASHFAEDDKFLQTEEEARDFFDMVSAVLEEHGVEDFLRIADHAEFISGREICGYHTARFLADGRDAMDAIKSRMILRRTGTQWRLTSVTNAVHYDTENAKRPKILPNLLAYRRIMERTKTWPNSR